MSFVDHDVKTETLPKYTVVSEISMVEDVLPHSSNHNHQQLPLTVCKSEDESRTYSSHNVCVNVDHLKAIAISAKNAKCTDINTICIRLTALSFYRRQRQAFIPFMWGILVGVTFATLFFQQILLFMFHFKNLKYPNSGSLIVNNAVLHEANRNFDLSLSLAQLNGNKEPIESSFRNSSIKKILKKVKNDKTSIFVGVITAGKFLGTRAIAVNNTWGSQVDGIQFFTQRGSGNEYKLPVVNLERASDSEYPPQKKAFEMLKHMCIHHIDDYKWFVRADDDVYIRVDRLKQFLTTIDSDRMIYMGQPGHGVPEVRDKLGLRGHNFCMGGPGVIFNRRALKALCPHIDECMSEVVTGEEDVEIGRCVTNHIHIECTHAWETLKLFYHSYQEEYAEEKPFLGNLAENDHVSGALTLHHLKLPYIMYKVHRHYTSVQLNETMQKIEDLRKKLQRVNSEIPLGQKYQTITEKLILAASKPKSMSQSHSWKAFSTDAIYSLSTANGYNDIVNDVLADLKQIGETGIDEAIGNSQGQKFTYSHVSGGYTRSDSRRGTDYFLDVYFNSKISNISNESRRVHILRPTGSLLSSGSKHINLQGERPFFVLLVTSAKSVTQFESFMQNYYEPLFIIGEPPSLLKLLVAVVEDQQSDLKSQSPSTKEIVSWYRDKYPEANLEILPNVDKNFTGRNLSIDSIYARGIVYINQLLTDSNAKQSAVVLLTTTSVRFSRSSIENCILRTFSTSNSFDKVLSEQKNCHDVSNSSAQIYQPIPFTPYPDSDVQTRLSNSESKSDFVSLQLNKINSDIGVWSMELSNLDNNGEHLTPLCGDITTLYKPARMALDTLGEPSVSFKRALYDLVYDGSLSMLRSPDQDFYNVPAR